MLKIENVDIFGWEPAIRGMRNPKNSWDKSDSYPCMILEELTPNNISFRCSGCKNENASRPNCTIIGKNDYELMEKLSNAGTDHRKFMRMITVYLDILAPLYWWKEFDTYKVGTVANSCSTMHKIADKEFTLEDFSTEHLMRDAVKYNGYIPITVLECTIGALNEFRKLYLETKDKTYWWQMIQLLPSSYNQRRTVMLNYEVLANIYKSRREHKLDEWHTFCDWIESLPYAELINRRIYFGSADAEKVAKSINDLFNQEEK